MAQKMKKKNDRTAYRLTQKQYEKRVKEYSPNIKIIGKYRGTGKQINVECLVCGEIWKPVANYIITGEKNKVRCPNCNGVKQKTFKDLKELIYSISNDNVNLIDCDKDDNEKINTKKDYKVFNKICGHNWYINYNRISTHGISCPYCANKKVLEGFNDIATTAPWMVELLKNKNNAFKYMRCSNKKIDWVCKCGKEILNKSPNEIYQHGLICPNCSDKISYPEKMISNMLSELKVNYKTQYKIDGYSYKYDFYLFDYNYIIEVHGNQHYDEHGFGSFYEDARTLSEEQQNDVNKKNLAISMGYNYIILDCRKSELDYIKESILNSKLSELFNNIVDLDWNKIHVNSLKSKLIYICELYNDNYSIDEICLMNGISNKACTGYLRKGSTCRLCDYSGIERKIKALDKIHENTKKAIRCITTGEIFDSITSAVKKYGFSMSLLSAHLNGRRRKAGVDPVTGQDLIWEFV